MDRKYIDCRDVPNAQNCSLKISGKADEVVNTVADHAIKVHGEKDTADLREHIRSNLRDDFESHQTDAEFREPAIGAAPEAH